MREGKGAGGEKRRGEREKRGEERGRKEEREERNQRLSVTLEAVISPLCVCVCGLCPTQQV